MRSLVRRKPVPEFESSRGERSVVKHFVEAKCVLLIKNLVTIIVVV